MRLQSLLVVLETVMLVLFHCQVYGFNFLYGHVEELGNYYFFSVLRHSGTKMKRKT